MNKAFSMLLLVAFAFMCLSVRATSLVAAPADKFCRVCFTPVYNTNPFRFYASNAGTYVQNDGVIVLDTRDKTVTPVNFGTSLETPDLKRTITIGDEISFEYKVIQGPCNGGQPRVSVKIGNTVYVHQANGVEEPLQVGTACNNPIGDGWHRAVFKAKASGAVTNVYVVVDHQDASLIYIRNIVIAGKVDVTRSVLCTAYLVGNPLYRFFGNPRSVNYKGAELDFTTLTDYKNSDASCKCDIAVFKGYDFQKDAKAIHLTNKSKKLKFSITPCSYMLTCKA